MKKSFFSSGKVVAFVLLTPLILAVPLVALPFIDSVSRIILSAIVAIAVVTAWAIVIIVYKNAFCRITIDECGISNKYLHLSFSQIERIRFLEIRIRRPVALLDTVCLFGDLTDSKFRTIDPKKTIVISARHLQTIEKMAGARFECVRTEMLK